MIERTPAEVFPPGEFLRDELDARGWTQGEFAEIISRPPRLVNEIIAGERGITTETAREFSAAFCTSAQLWLNLQEISRAAILREKKEGKNDRTTARGA